MSNRHIHNTSMDRDCLYCRDRSTLLAEYEQVIREWENGTAKVYDTEIRNNHSRIAELEALLRDIYADLGFAEVGSDLWPRIRKAALGEQP